MEEWKDSDNWNRNQALIDMTKIPEDYRTKILNDFEKEYNQGRSQLLNYFIQKNLKNLMTNIGDF